MRKIFIIATALLALCACQSDPFKDDIAFPFARQEAGLWTGKLQEITPLEGSALKIKYKYDPAMEEPGQFSYSFSKNHTLTLTSSDAAGVLDALYTFCEDLGILYDITGQTLPASVNWKSLEGTERLIAPRVRWRGIRQHVNFSMDISSYPIPQAREYLENMVRLRMNKFTIHSYPFQWYAEDVTGTMNYAGKFFYGDVHRVDGWDFLKDLCKDTNKKYFCIPEGEPVFEDAAKCSEVAEKWMSELIDAAKEVGLRVQFSVENRKFTPEQTAKLAYVLTDKFAFDDLEFITEENGGGESEVGVPYAKQQLDNSAEAIKLLEADPGFQGRVDHLKLGIYCVNSNDVGGIFKYARTLLPDHYVAVLPGYASRQVADAYPKIIDNAEDLKWIELYSWIEFDGLMYLQENNVEGIDDILTMMDRTAPGVQHRSLEFNHWRTAENRTVFRYAAEATLINDRHQDDFYKEYASRLGIKNEKAFLDIHHALEDLNNFNIAHNFNIGFAWIGCWQRDNLGMFKDYNLDMIKEASDRFLKIGEMLTDLYNGTEGEAAREYLGFLGNRVLCSKLYLDAYSEAAAIRDIPLMKDGSAAPAYRKKAGGIFEKSIAAYERMIRIYAQQLPDRGCLGMCVDFWNGPVYGLIKGNHNLCGASMDGDAGKNIILDSPPLPAFFE